MSDYVAHALKEAAQDSKRGDLGALLERAYSLGYRADWDGSVELEIPVRLGDGHDVQNLIDTDLALDVEAAFKAGHLTAAEYEAGMKDPAESAETMVSPAAIVGCSSPAVAYVWNWRGTTAACFSTGATNLPHPNSSLRFDELCVRNNNGRGFMRAQSRYINAAGSYVLTQIRTASGAGYICNSMGAVTGVNAYVWWNGVHNAAPNPYI